MRNKKGIFSLTVIKVRIFWSYVRKPIKTRIIIIKIKLDKIFWKIHFLKQNKNDKKVRILIISYVISGISQWNKGTARIKLWPVFLPSAYWNMECPVIPSGKLNFGPWLTLFETAHFLVPKSFFFGYRKGAYVNAELLKMLREPL